MHAQLDLVTTARVIGDPASPRHGFVAVGIDQQPAVATAALQQVLNAAIEHLAQRCRAGGLLQMPEEGSVAPMQRPQLQGGWQGGQGRSVADRPAPEPLGALGLEAVFPEQGQAVVIEAGGGGDPAHSARGLLDRFPQQG